MEEDLQRPWDSVVSSHLENAAIGLFNIHISISSHVVIGFLHIVTLLEVTPLSFVTPNQTSFLDTDRSRASTCSFSFHFISDEANHLPSFRAVGPIWTMKHSRRATTVVSSIEPLS